MGAEGPGKKVTWGAVERDEDVEVERRFRRGGHSYLQTLDKGSCQGQYGSF